MPAPVSVDLSGSLGYAGDPPVRLASLDAVAAGGAIAQVIRMIFAGVSVEGDYIQLAYEFQLEPDGPIYGDIESPAGIFYEGEGLSAAGEAAAVSGFLTYGEGNLTPYFDITTEGGTLYLTRKVAAANMPAFEMTADPDGGAVVTATTLVDGLAITPPVGIDLEGSAYVGDAPVSIDREGSDYTGEAPVSVVIPGGGERALYFPQTVALNGVRNGSDHTGVVNYDGQVVHYNGEAATT